MQNKSGKKAFTLVELAVAMAVTVVFLALATVLLANVLDEKEDTNKDALIAYELLLVETRVESWFYNFSTIEQGKTPCTFAIYGENKNVVVAYRDSEEVGRITYDSENNKMISSDRERVTEFKDVTDVSFEVVNGNAVKVIISFESLQTPVVRLFTQKGGNYA